MLDGTKPFAENKPKAERISHNINLYRPDVNLITYCTKENTNYWKMLQRKP
jgi:hypothetical protein